jgi:hypothetical protein
VFRPVTTDCRGERRFISTIARRLDSLGALTRGQRQTGGQNLFDPADNLESDYAREALTRWYHLLHGGKLASIAFADFCERTGLKLEQDGALTDSLPPIQRWLNRILALPIGLQNAVFDEFLGLVEARIDAARKAGTFDAGVETLVADQLTIVEERVLREDANGAQTQLLTIEAQWAPKITTLEEIGKRIGAKARMLRNGRSLRIPIEAGQGFRREAGHHSGLKPATVPTRRRPPRQGRLSVGLEERGIAVRQIHAEIMEPDQLAANDPVRFTKVHLRVPRPVAQRNENLAAAQLAARHVLAHNRYAAGKTMLIAQPLEDPPSRMPLLGMHRAIVGQYPVDDLGEAGQLPAVRNPAPTMLWGFRKNQHLVDRLAINPKVPRRGPAAHPVNDHGMANLLIKLHSLHPPPPHKCEGLAGMAPF